MERQIAAGMGNAETREWRAQNTDVLGEDTTRESGECMGIYSVDYLLHYK